MVTSTRRDVKLVVDAETSGEPQLTQMAAALRAIGQNAGDAAPNYERLAAAADLLQSELGPAAEKTKILAAAEDAATAAKRAAYDALERNRLALSRLRVETTGAARDTDVFKNAEQNLKLAIQQSREDLSAAERARKGAADAARKAAAAEAELARQAQGMAVTYRAAVAEMSGAATPLAQSLERIHATLNKVQLAIVAAFGGSMVVQALKSVSDTTDAVTNLQARLKLVTGEGQSFADAWRGVQQVAQSTNSALETTGTLFSRIAQAGKEMGVSQREALALTETINQAIQVGGASAQASDAAITQLIQGLQSGVVRGEEFNSVMEQAPRLAQALADGLGVTTGELRKMAEAGALTTQTVIGALRGQAEAVRTEYASLPPTVGRSIQQLSNAWSIYVNEASTATGASKAAAEAISTLARHLDDLGAVLLGVGKAAAGYAAINLAKSFFETATAVAAATAAKTAHTAATVAHTTATAANSTALVANAAATAAATTSAEAGAGRLASIVSNLKTFSLVGVLLNIREIGTAVGEWTARMTGAEDASKKLEGQLEAEAEATRRNADAKAALAQRTQQAADAALGLSTEARKLVGEFSQVVAAGDGATAALDKLTKALKLGDIKGIQDASAALDALAQRGKIAGDQVRQALAAALKTEDLARFEAQARAAFDSSTQGARRLQAALDAIATESLRRAGTSVQELRSGFSEATTAAINDLDALARTLDQLGARGEAAGRALSASLSKALDAAQTTQAVQAVIDRIEALGRAGMLAGDQLAEALGKARAKLDELKPGISSVEEAFKRLGLTAPTELNRIAAASAEAWQRIKNDGTVALADKQRAFEAYAKTVTAMAGTEAAALLEIQGKALGLSVTFDAAGKAIVRSMTEAGAATERFRGQMGDLAAQADRTARSLSTVYEAQRKAWADTVDAHKLGGATYDKQGFATDASGNRITGGSYVPPPDDSGEWEWVPGPSLASLQRTIPILGYTDAQMAGGKWVRKGGSGYSLTGTSISNPAFGTGGGTSTPAAAPAPAASTSHTVAITINGVTKGTVNVASASDADRLAALLRELEDSARSGG